LFSLLVLEGIAQTETSGSIAKPSTEVSRAGVGRTDVLTGSADHPYDDFVLLWPARTGSAVDLAASRSRYGHKLFR